MSGRAGTVSNNRAIMTLYNSPRAQMYLFIEDTSDPLAGSVILLEKIFLTTFVGVSYIMLHTKYLRLWFLTRF